MSATETSPGVEDRPRCDGVWRLRSIGECGEVMAGKALNAKGPGNPKPYLRTVNVLDGEIRLHDVLQMPMTGAEYQRNVLRDGDVLLNEGQSLELVGRCAIVPADLDGRYAIQNQLVRFRAYEDTSKLYASYLFRHFHSNGVFQKISLQTTSIAHLGVSRFARLNASWPPLPEQRAIAAALSDADDLLQSLDRLIAKKRDVKHGVMQQLLTGTTRLPGFEGAWETKRLGDLGETYGGLSGKTKDDFGHGEETYVTFLNAIENVTLREAILEPVDIRPDERQNRVRPGDLIFNGTSETPDELAMGSVVPADFPTACLNSFCFGFRGKSGDTFDPNFLAYTFRGTPGRMLLRALAQGATRYNLSKSQFRDLTLPLPATSEQRAIAAVLSDMEAEIDALEARRDKVAAIKQGMMQELLTGRTRLPIPQEGN